MASSLCLSNLLSTWPHRLPRRPGNIGLDNVALDSGLRECGLWTGTTSTLVSSTPVTQNSLLFGHVHEPTLKLVSFTRLS
jgi:hypothetical protein